MTFHDMEIINTKSGEFLTLEESDILFACYWMVEHDATIRQTAKARGFSTTTLWRRIHKNCKEICPGMYSKVLDQIERNKKKPRTRREEG